MDDGTHEAGIWKIRLPPPATGLVVVIGVIGGSKSPEWLEIGTPEGMLDVVACSI